MRIELGSCQKFSFIIRVRSGRNETTVVFRELDVVVEACKDAKVQQDESYYSLLILTPIYLSFGR